MHVITHEARGAERHAHDHEEQSEGEGMHMIMNKA